MNALHPGHVLTATAHPRTLRQLIAMLIAVAVLISAAVVLVLHTRSGSADAGTAPRVQVTTPAQVGAAEPAGVDSRAFRSGSGSTSSSAPIGSSEPAGVDSRAFRSR